MPHISPWQDGSFSDREPRMTGADWSMPSCNASGSLQQSRIHAWPPFYLWVSLFLSHQVPQQYKGVTLLGAGDQQHTMT